jgi:hypothetical protein
MTGPLRNNHADDKDDSLSRLATEYLHKAELEKEGELLDQILVRDEKDANRSDHYNRGLVFGLLMQPRDALMLLERLSRFAKVRRKARGTSGSPLAGICVRINLA